MCVVCVHVCLCVYIDVKSPGKTRAHIWSCLTTASKEEKEKQAAHVIKGVREWAKYKKN